MGDTGRIDDRHGPLRDLFAETGPVHASVGLEAAVLAKLAREVAPAERRQEPLVPRWAWATAAVLCVGLMLLPQGQVEWSVPALPTLQMTGTAQWLLGALACATLLFALDALLKVRSARVHLN